ncbi:ATP-binding protein [Argonema antarcticum]|uniref:ATP-binding protein n=1 Tax=Argonema antarcticum TaxID=2942763 RepID=UPI002013B035|nr:AAA family ATPase [Argonema antarcticum]MCL1475110.1 AAA family ATPase [Argonema antarcticum A004/B2]
MQSLQDLSTLFDSGQCLVAVETPLTERLEVLEFLFPVAQKWRLPLYFWNFGYSHLRQVCVDDTIRLISTDIKCTGLTWLLDRTEVPGVFVFEGTLTPDASGRNELKQLAIISNLAYDLPTRGQQQFLVALETYIELPQELVPLVPVLVNPLPDASQVRQIVQDFCSQLFSAQESEQLVRTCLGLHLGELSMLSRRLLSNNSTAKQLIDRVLNYKKSKLKGQGIEFISEPDVPVAGGLDLLEGMLERAAALLKPEAKEHNLKFPKGMILWGPPGTGKSLSAKLAAKKMGVPMVAADWTSLRGATAYESRKNLREFLQLCDSLGEYGLVLYFDDFDKGFAGFDDDSDGGISRQLAGKLLTWMQERTSQVLVMATVNRLEFLPPELIRRFDDIVFVDIPHTGARYEIIKLHLARYFPGLNFSDKDWWRLLRETKMLTPAEIGNLVRQTAQEAFYRNTKQFADEQLGGQPLNVTVKDLLEQRYNFTPSMIREEDKIVEIRNKASYARPASSPDRSRWSKEPEVLFGTTSS